MTGDEMDQAKRHRKEQQAARELIEYRAELKEARDALKAAQADRLQAEREVEGLKVACSHARGEADAERQRFAAEREAKDKLIREGMAEKARWELEMGHLRVDLGRAKLDARCAELDRDLARHELARHELAALRARTTLAGVAE